MAVTYDQTVRTARMNATRSEVANGTMEILTSGDVVLATFGLDATAGSVTNNVWTLAFDATTVVASATGTATKVQLKSSGAVARITGLNVGTEVTIDNASITSGQNVTITGATITHII